MTEAKSARPQLPPRPKYMRPRNFDPADFVFGYEETNKYMKALEAENESLKAQIEERNNRGTGYLYVPKAQYDALKAERDQALEVIREYRKSITNHDGCRERHFILNGIWHDSRCPTCIKADELLLRKEK